MSGVLTPSGDKFCYEKLTYVDTLNNIKLSARVTAYSSNGKIAKIEEGEIVIDAVNQGNFNTQINSMGGDQGRLNISINNADMAYISLIGKTIGAMITEVEVYFAPSN